MNHKDWGHWQGYRTVFGRQEAHVRSFPDYSQSYPQEQEQLHRKTMEFAHLLLQKGQNGIVLHPKVRLEVSDCSLNS